MSRCGVMKRIVVPAFAVLQLTFVAAAQAPQGYYRQPALHGDTLVFVSEGDIWKAPLAGGVATRLTSHPGDESRPAISPDGKTLAFTAQYEGPTEIYSMPLAGGLPTRRTYDGAGVSFVVWTPDGKLLCGATSFATLPDPQLVTIDISNPAVAGTKTLIPLAQAAEGVYDETGRTLYFTRLRFQGSHTRRYKGGTAQNLWRFADGDAEATPLTADYAGTSRQPMWWQGRVYFASDRDGVMNLWSMEPDGSDLKQHTRHKDYEVLGPSLGNGRIAYQHGADIRVYDIAADTDSVVPLTLDTDLDQMRERWVKDPLEWVSAAHLAPDGSRAALTARGRVYVAPHRQGRLIEVTQPGGGTPAAINGEAIRYRDAKFLPDGKNLLVLSDQSGEVEFWKAPANGVGPNEQLTRDGAVLRWEGVPSPDGKWLGHTDKNQKLYLLNLETKENRKIDESPIGDIGGLAWSPNSKWLAYVKPADNFFSTIQLYSIADGTITPATTDRFDSYSPAWSADGKWLYFLSDRNLTSLVGSPWGSYQPEPFLDRKTELFALALQPGERSPFAPLDELNVDKKDEPAKPSTSPVTQTAPATQTLPATQTAPAGQPSTTAASEPTKPAVDVKIEKAGLAARLYELPVSAGNYGNLAVNDKALFFTSAPVGENKTHLVAIPIARENVELKTVVSDIKGYELSQDGKKLLVSKGTAYYILDASAAPADLDKKDVNLGAFSLSVIPREEWRQMFDEAWRLERDYFYDPGMHSVDWAAMRAKYRPLVDRVATRIELADVLAQMVAELSALHIFVYGGDARSGQDQIAVASLGATLARDEAAGGYRITRIYQSDPDDPTQLSPLAMPQVNAAVGDLILSINGVPTLSVADMGEILRRKAGQQVLVKLKPAAGGESREAIATPITSGAAGDLRYRDWEYSRRQMVDQLGENQIGYVHLRAMGGGNFSEWARNFYPVFTRSGLIIDVRHNRGGNIDSWIIGRLLRKAWFFWTQRVGRSPNWNMQYAFRGHIAVLCDEFTASDGEAFTEGVKRLKLGRVFGKRTWGGEIWLSSSNFLVDRGIATAAESGVYGPAGDWLIEGHGVEPDEVVDNLPHATFKGDDAQLKAAIEYLKRKIKEEPVDPPPQPRYPDKSGR